MSKLAVKGWRIDSPKLSRGFKWAIGAQSGMTAKKGGAARLAVSLISVYPPRSRLPQGGRSVYRRFDRRLHRIENEGGHPPAHDHASDRIGDVLQFVRLT